MFSAGCLLICSITKDHMAHENLFICSITKDHRSTRILVWFACMYKPLH